jgi:hypothetical protein
MDTNPVSPGRHQNRQITGFQLAGHIPPAALPEQSDLFNAGVFGSGGNGRFFGSVIDGAKGLV